MADHYLWIKLIHIVSSTVLFGTGLGTAFQMLAAHRSGDVRAIAVVTRNVVWADWLFTTPAVIVQPVTGVLLARAAGYGVADSWLVVSVLLYLIAGACWLPVVWMQIRMRDLAAAAAADGGPLPPLYHRMARWWFALGWPAFTGLVGVFYLMVQRPVLW